MGMRIAIIKVVVLTASTFLVIGTSMRKLSLTNLSVALVIREAPIAKVGDVEPM